MGMRAAQIHKAGALEDPRTEADDEGRDRIGGRFSMFDPTAKSGSIASRTWYGLKRSGVRGRPPRARACFRVSSGSPRSVSGSPASKYPGFASVGRNVSAGPRLF